MTMGSSLWSNNLFSFHNIHKITAKHISSSDHHMTDPMNNAMAQHTNFSEAAVMAALTTLSQPHLSRLTTAISDVFHHRHRRLISLLSSPILFSLSLKHLQSLSLHHKSLLIARYLISNLNILHHFIRKTTTTPPPPQIPAICMKLRDLDAVLLLLLLCEIHQYKPELLDARPELWRDIVSEYLMGSMSRLSTFRGYCISSSCDRTAHEVLVQYIECVGRCWNFVKAIGSGGGGEVAALVKAVVALPSVEADGGGDCVICKEEMEKGREVCKLPCNHLFHWICILRWFKKRNTCPCCRHQLPSDDVGSEIRRLLEDFAQIGGDW